MVEHKSFINADLEIEDLQDYGQIILTALKGEEELLVGPPAAIMI